MNQIEAVKHKVERQLPGVSVYIDKPLRSRGIWLLDCMLGKRHVSVEWRRHRGFGISSSPDHGFGEGPEEILSDVEGTARRILQLLGNGAETTMPEELTLKELRARQRLSQAEFAHRLQVSQAAVSELESDLSRSKLSTVLKALKALGAKLEVFAVLSPKRAFKLKL